MRTETRRNIQSANASAVPELRTLQIIGLPDLKGPGAKHSSPLIFRHVFGRFPRFITRRLDFRLEDVHIGCRERVQPHTPLRVLLFFLNFLALDSAQGPKALSQYPESSVV